MEIIIATTISVLIQLIKKIYKSFVGEDWKDIAVIGTLLVFSFIAGWVVYLLKETNAWESFYQIVFYSAGFWALIIRQFEK